MKETFPTSLEDQRFHISAESFAVMKETREMFLEMKEKYPEVYAMSFYGSRTQGRGKKTSDLDAFILFDLDRKKNKEISNDPALLKVLEKFARNMKKKYPGFKLEEHWLDTSAEITGEDFKDFKEDPWRGEFGANSERFGREGMPEGHVALISRFMLGVGDIYAAREAVFDFLEKDKDGEKIFRALMQRLQEIERPDEVNRKDVSLPNYSYPTTIAEGKKYFLSHKQIPASDI